jgi:Flp pilus assembly secretin CpaC
MPAFPFTAATGWRIAALSFAGLAGAVMFAASAAATEPISVIVDRAKVLHISQPADVVIIGNPAIADATIQDSQTLIITGRSFGTTNLIVLDKQGQSIADTLVTVEPSNDQVVTVYRRASRQTLSCTPECSPVMTLGDNPSSFDAVNTQIQAARSLADSATQH